MNLIKSPSNRSADELVLGSTRTHTV